MANIKDSAKSRLFTEIKEALKSVNYGSIEIFVQNNIVTQITVRNIKKTNVDVQSEGEIRKANGKRNTDMQGF